MPIGIYTRTEKAKNNMKKAAFGKKKSISHRMNIAKAKMGIKNPMFGKASWNKGKIFTLEELVSQGKSGITKIQGYNSFRARRRQIRKLKNGGFHTLAEWENLKAQYNWTCPCCNKSEPEIKLTEDHIIPLKKGGSDNIENVQPLCRGCNSKKYTKIIKFNKQNGI